MCILTPKPLSSIHSHIFTCLVLGGLKHFCMPVPQETASKIFLHATHLKFWTLNENGSLFSLARDQAITSRSRGIPGVARWIADDRLNLKSFETTDSYRGNVCGRRRRKKTRPLFLMESKAFYFACWSGTWIQDHWDLRLRVCGRRLRQVLDRRMKESWFAWERANSTERGENWQQELKDRKPGTND